METDVLPYLGGQRVPPDLIVMLAKSLQNASRLYDLDLPGVYSGPPTPAASANGSLSDDDRPPKETRFTRNYDVQAVAEMDGTTAEITPRPRERFAYWCLDLMFLMCSSRLQGELGLTFAFAMKQTCWTSVRIDREDSRRRVAALGLPSLLNRCAAVIKSYLADAPLRGKMPFPR